MKFQHRFLFLSLAYPYAMEAHVDGAHARSAKVIHFNAPVNPLFLGIRNGQPLKSATTPDSVQQEEELLYSMPLADPL